MEDKQVQKPTLCMERDKKAEEFVIDCLNHNEPCAVIGMTGMGKDVIFEDLVQKIDTISPDYEKKIANITTVEDLQSLIEDIRKTEKPLICLINVRIGEDVSSYITRLGKLRHEKSVAFVPVIFAYIGDVYTALKNLEKILVVSQFVLTLVTKADTDILLEDFEKRYAYRLSQKEKDTIYEMGQGLVGLMKSLFLYAKSTPNADWRIETLAQVPAILYRVQAALNEFPTDMMKEIASPHAADRLLFEKYGYLRDGKIFSPLFQHILERKYASSQINFQRLFTTQELGIFHFLLSKIDDVITREDMAKELWKDNWEEKYSDWAIDQLMHTMREKIRQASLPYEIITKKGEGFILVEKS